MKKIFFFIKRIVATHKLTYSKTMKADLIAAGLGIITGSTVSWLCLSVVGAGSVDLTDLVVFLYYGSLLCIVLYIINKLVLLHV